ncbi:pantetheine-phosphate adenylyltransferase [Flammeovirgaceae bacterium SG7u.111]|nr:pantetheine-phosphate adenylyltransferase [Flammeovirgaceae bacterium SG7u.132]WPO38805.1 pantetheine-phosphate adenylyltransferase [Flammeovirgaceae bacterium SG7u.111]
MSRIALFPGSFDPFTKGHADVVHRGSKIFDQVIVSVGHNAQKKRFFPVEVMVEKISEAFAGQDNVKVVAYEELTAELAKKLKAKFLLRGLRNTTDFEYENTIAQVNRHIFDDLETVFLITSPKYAYINSTIVREIYRFGQNVDEFLPYNL